MPKGQKGRLCLNGLCPCRHEASRRLFVKKEPLLRASLKVLGLEKGYYRDDLVPLVRDISERAHGSPPEIFCIADGYFEPNKTKFQHADLSLTELVVVHTSTTALRVRLQPQYGL